MFVGGSLGVGRLFPWLLWAHILLLQPIALQIPAHLDVVSDMVKAPVKRALSLLLLAPASGC